MPVADLDLAERGRRGQETMRLRRQQRRDLRGASPQQLVRVVLNPPRELAGATLKVIFAPRTNDGVIPLFCEQKLDRALAKLRREGHEWAHGHTRLRQLSTHQRRQLMRAILEFAPRGWTEGSA